MRYPECFSRSYCSNGNPMLSEWSPTSLTINTFAVGQTDQCPTCTDRVCGTRLPSVHLRKRSGWVVRGSTPAPSSSSDNPAPSTWLDSKLPYAGEVRMPVPP